jgi:hypothetical protein
MAQVRSRSSCELGERVRVEMLKTGSENRFFGDKTVFKPVWNELRRRRNLSWEEE